MEKLLGKKNNQMLKEIKIYKNFLSSEEIGELLTFARDTSKDWGKTDNEFWDGRFIHSQDLKNEKLENLLVSKREEIKNIIKEDYGIEETLYSDLLQIVRWTSGYELKPHADAENPNQDSHPFPYREVASITYLNNDFSGGEIYFPNKENYCPPIEPGMLVFFPGTLEFLHGVKEVTEGTRYTIASFFTRDKSKADFYDRERKEN